MANFLEKQINKKLAIVILIGIFLITSLIIVLIYISSSEIPSISQLKNIKKFSSEEEFKTYLLKAPVELGYFGGPGGVFTGRAMPLLEEAPSTVEKTAPPERISETTVQVPGIDEPDIVKTDGKEIYFSPGYVFGILEEPSRLRTIPSPTIPPQEEAKTNIVKAFPPSDLSVEANIDKSGDLLLDKNTLVIFSGKVIYGYNISNPESPEKKWDIKLENDSSVVDARLYKNKIYLVVRTGIKEDDPSPIKPLSVNGIPLTIEYREIYYPIVPIPVDVTYTAFILDPGSGEIEKNVSFVGSSGTSVVYMSEKSIYVTYSYYEDIFKFLSNFLKEKLQDITPTWLIEKTEKLAGYDISQSAKLLEFQVIWGKYITSLSDDERLRIEKEFSDRLSDYYKEHKRELEKTGIVKIALDGFEVAATGDVPGYPLNQFALDEYKDYLRIATTIGERWWGFGFGISGGESASASEVYVLDKDLNMTGSVKDLGLKERIYAVRFIEDKGYLVTFRETDPFYILDLANPQKPELKGELKIPGYSSYLHPITNDKILGVGKEDWQVKISLFDVSLPEKPQELDKYILDEPWSEVLSTQHAFLLDKKHEIFFLPGSRGGYVFSYKNDKLGLTKAVSEISARRALYINDYLYIVSDNKISVLNETDWEKVKEIQLYLDPL